MLNGKKIVVVMPAYNAEKTLEKTYNEIFREIVDEIILTDDKVYWEKDGAKFNYCEFAIKDGDTIKAGAKNWGAKTPLTPQQLKAKYGFRANAIDTKSYSINWDNYYSNYRFLLFEIK